MNKKLLAILCAVSVLVSALAGTMVASFAEGSTGNEAAESVSPYVGEGESLRLEDTAVLAPNFGPTEKAGNANITSVDNTSGLPVNMYCKVGAARIPSDAVDAGAGTLMYVESPATLPEGTDNYVYKLYHGDGDYGFEAVTKSKYFRQPSGQTWYYYDVENAQWVGGEIAAHGLTLPVGFKGFVYVPSATLTTYSRPNTDFPDKAQGFVAEGDKLAGIYLWDNTASSEVRFSEPIFVKGAVDKSAPTFDNVVINGRRYYLDPAKNSGEDTAVLAPNFAPTEKAGNANITEVYNTSGFPVKMYSKVGAARIPSDAVDAGAGTLMYVESPATLPEGTDNYVYKLYHGDGDYGFEAVTKSKYFRQPSGQIWYYFDVEKYCWVGGEIAAHGLTLPVGFKGFVYVPSATLTTYSRPNTDFPDKAQGFVAEGDKLAGIYLWDNTASSEVRFSEPIFIKGAVDKTPPAFDHVIIDGVQYYLDPSKNPKPAPNYNIPNYSGAKEDYKTLSFANVTVAVTDKELAPGAMIPESVISVDGDNTLAIIESLVGITKMPSFEVTKTATNDDFSTAVYNTDYSKYMGAEAAMIYVKNPADSTVGVRVDWKFAQSESVTAEGTQFGSSKADSANPMCKVYVLAKGADAWQQLNVVKGVVTLPANFEGYIRYDYQNLYLSDDFGYALDETWGLAGAEVMFEGLEAEQKVMFSAPMIVNNLTDSVVGKAYIGFENKAVRDIFTGEIVLADALLGSEDDDDDSGNSGNQGGTTTDDTDYRIPAYTGEAQNYMGLTIMKARMSKLVAPIKVGTAIDPSIIHSEPDSNDKPIGDEKYVAIDSVIGITNMPSIEMTEPTTPGSKEGWYSYVIFQHDYTKNYDSDSVMVYMENPKDAPLKLRISWNWTKRDGTWATSNVYSSTTDKVQIMDVNTQEWESVAVDAYLFEVPANFKGYVKYNLNGLNVPGKGEILDKDWGLLETWILFYELKAGDKIKVSPPILLEGFSKEAVDNIAYIEGETNVARNLFTGEPVIGNEVEKPSQGEEGESNKLEELPKATTEEKPTLTDKSKLTTEGKASVEWNVFDGAASYELRVYKNLATYDGSQYIREYELVNTIKTNETKAELADLELNMRYSLVVYALDSNGGPVAIYDFITASTMENALAQDKDNTSSDTQQPVQKPATEDTVEETETIEGLSMVAIFAIIEAVALVIAVAAIIAIAVSKKRKA